MAAQAEIFAAVDLGTNTALLTVAQLREGRLEAVLERAVITRLGRGLGPTGALDPKRATHTLEVLEDYARLARGAGATQIRAAATSTLRRADDGAEFVARVAERCGLQLEVIGGDEEARLSYLAQARDPRFSGAGALRVLDIGGGSTEVVLGEGPALEHAVSLEIGSVRLAEAELAGEGAPGAEARRRMIDRARAIVDAAAIPTAPAQLVAVAGTATTLATMDLALEVWDAEKVHGYSLSRARLAELSARLCSLDLAGRQALPGVEAKRADVLPAGAAILEAVMDATASEAVKISDRGVRWGLLYEMAGR